MLELDGSPPLSCDLQDVHPLLLVEPPLGVLKGRDLPLLGYCEVQLLEHFRSLEAEPLDDVLLRLGGVPIFSDGQSWSSSFSR